MYHVLEIEKSSLQDSMESLFGTLDNTSLQVLAYKNVKHKQPCERIRPFDIQIKRRRNGIGIVS